MSAIMEYFNAEFREFRDDCEKIMLDVNFIGNCYPPMIQIKGQPVWEQQSFDGIEPTEKKMPEVTVKGGVDTSVSVRNLAMAKKDFTKIVGRAEKLLVLWLHAFCEEKMEANCPE